MAGVRVIHDIDDLARDLAEIPVQALVKGSEIVRKNTNEGNKIAQRFARASAGPHGKLYYKRLTAEMTGPLEGEYGPRGVVAGRAVGAGWRNGPPNTDLEKSQDVIGPKFARDVGEMADGLFWT